MSLIIFKLILDNLEKPSSVPSIRWDVIRRFFNEIMDSRKSIISGIKELSIITIYTDIYARNDIQNKSEELPVSKS